MDRAEANREAAEERAWEHYNLTRQTREAEYLAWCSLYNLDPEVTESMVEYERMWVRYYLDDDEAAQWPELAS